MVVYQVLGVSLWLALVVAIAEWVARRSALSREVSRKIVHIGAGNAILLAWWLGIPAWVGIAAAVVSGVITFTSRWYSVLMSVSEVGRNSWGTFFYAVSMGLLIAIFWPIDAPAYAVLGVLVMAWGDGFAAIIGQRFGKHPYELWGMRKSWEGTGTMAIVSGAVSLAVLFAANGISWPVLLTAIAVTLVATGLEAFSKFGIDNLTVPLGSAGVGYGLIQWWVG